MMQADSATVASPAAAAPTAIAGFWRRLAAFLIDSIVVSVPTFLLGVAFFEWAASLGQAGRLVGFAAALIYFGLLNSRLGGGQTIGKRLLGIRVMDRTGNTLSPMRSSLRFLVLAVPYFLNGLWFDVDLPSLGVLEIVLGSLLACVVFGGLGAIIYLFVFNRRTRQSLHDLVAGSFVVRGLPKPVPAVLTTPRLHLIVIACWFALALVAPGVVVLTMRDSSDLASLAPLAELRQSIETQLGLRPVKIRVGQQNVTTVKTGQSTTTFLLVDVRTARASVELGALSSAIARTVLDRHPDLLGRQVLVVNVQRGFDLGIARWNVNHRAALDAASWRERLAALPAGR